MTLTSPQTDDCVRASTLLVSSSCHKVNGLAFSSINSDKKKKKSICAVKTSWAVMSKAAVWIQVTGEMQGSQEAVIHRASSFVAPRDEHHNTGPYLARSLPKHTWRHTAKHTHIHKNTDRDNNLTAKHKVEWNLTTAATRNPITSFWSFPHFCQLYYNLSQARWCITHHEQVSARLSFSAGRQGNKYLFRR